MYTNKSQGNTRKHTIVSSLQKIPYFRLISQSDLHKANIQLLTGIKPPKFLLSSLKLIRYNNIEFTYLSCAVLFGLSY